MVEAPKLEDYVYMSWGCSPRYLSLLSMMAVTTFWLSFILSATFRAAYTFVLDDIPQ